MYRKALILALLLLLPVESRKIGGFGGGSGRGGSAGRGSAGGSHQPSGSYGGGGNPQSGYRPQAPQQPAYHPGGYPNQPQPGYHPGGYQPQPGYHPSNTGFNQGGYGGYHPQPGFHPGTGPGSVSSGSQWKTALAAGAVGAVGGIVTYELGKAIIKSATEPAHINGRPYYFNNENNQAPQHAGALMCSMPLDDLIKQTQPSTTAAPTTMAVTLLAGSNDTETTNATVTATTPSPDQLLSSLQFKDGSRPKTVTWQCKQGAEVCCGTECCPAPTLIAPNQGSGGPNSVSNAKGTSILSVVLGVLLLLALLTCCCCCIFCQSCRSTLQSFFPTSHEQDTPYNDAGKFDNSQTQGYATYQSQPLPQADGSIQMQAYPGMQQQSGYPAAPGYVYPSQPTGYQQYPPQQQYQQHY